MSSNILETMVPPLPSGALLVDAPVRTVVLLEDRAQVQRQGKVLLPKGQHRVVVKDVATVLQDVSLRASASGTARVVDARVQRALRVRAKDRPEAARELEERLEGVQQRHEAARMEAERAAERLERVQDMLQRASQELPMDAGWGLTHTAPWKDAMDALFARSRSLQEQLLAANFTMEDLRRETENLVRQRRALDRPDQDMVAWLEADVACDVAGEVELSFEYVTPNALWRPLHQAQLQDDGTLHFSSSAAVWQSTGEDWKDARLSFSTARSSLGTEPPTLSDDPLSAQKKAEQVSVQARQVAIQKAGLGSGGGGGGGGGRPAGVELPGVDDGGNIQNIQAKAPATVPGDGRPCMVPLFSFVDRAQVSLLCLPELDGKVFVKSIQSNRAAHPVLAGPVELLREHGFVGWTQVLFVAPQERFELSFGPEESLRVTRTEHRLKEPAHVDTWTRHAMHTALFLSNLGDQEKTLEMVERIPVSEIEQVRVELLADHTSHSPSVDKDGMVRWQVAIPAHGNVTVTLGVRLAAAPGVQGL